MKIWHYFTLGERQKKPILSELTQVFCGLLSLLPKYLKAKIKCIVSFAAVVCSRYTMPSIPSWRESIVWRAQITVVKEPTLTAIPLTKRISKLFVYSWLPQKYNSMPFYYKNKLKLCCISNRPKPKISQSRISEDPLNKRKG